MFNKEFIAKTNKPYVVALGGDASTLKTPFRLSQTS
jgi:hypothetical protein